MSVAIRGRTEERVECFEEIECVRCAVDLVVEVWSLGSVHFSREIWKQRLRIAYAIYVSPSCQNNFTFHTCLVLCTIWIWFINYFAIKMYFRVSSLTEMQTSCCVWVWVEVGHLWWFAGPVQSRQSSTFVIMSILFMRSPWFVKRRNSWMLFTELDFPTVHFFFSRVFYHCSSFILLFSRFGLWLSISRVSRVSWESHGWSWLDKD